jgi:hypothetical protein
VEEVVELRKAHPHWGPRKLLNLMHRRDPRRELPSVSTGARILAREGLIKPPGLLGQAGDVIAGCIPAARRPLPMDPTTYGPRTTRGSSG